MAFTELMDLKGPKIELNIGLYYDEKKSHSCKMYRCNNTLMRHKRLCGTILSALAAIMLREIISQTDQYLVYLQKHMFLKIK